MADSTDRFFAPPPIVIPPDATRAEELKLRYGSNPPPKGTQDRKDYESLIEGK